MARQTDDIKAVLEFLLTAEKEIILQDDNGEYIAKIKKYAERIKQEDTDFDCFISILHIVKGIGILDIKTETCLIVAENERSVRDFMRCVPNNVKFTFYFDPIYHSVISEYVFGDSGRNASCCLTGARRVNPAETGNGNVRFTERLITSKKDEVVSEFRSLTTLRSRIETGRIVMEGSLMVNRALKDNLQVEKVVYADNISPEEKKTITEACEKNGIPCSRAGQGLMSSMTTTNPVPEVLCITRVKALNQKELIISKKRNFFLILDGISNPDNLGMVLRTADASGVDAVILLSPSVHHFNKNSIRGARGAVGRIPIYFCSDDFELIDTLLENDFKIWGTSARFQASNFYDISYSSDNIAVIVGNESNGVRKEILDKCTDYVKIPMVDGQSSLNIAVAAALVMYEYDREFYQDDPKKLN